MIPRSGASCSTCATSASARRSRTSCAIRRSTTRSPAWPTGRCSRTACGTRWRPAANAAAAGGAVPRPRRLQDGQRQSRPRRRRRAAAERSPRGSTRSCARPTRPPDSAATSSRCCSRRSTTQHEAQDDRGADPRRPGRPVLVDGRELQCDRVDRASLSATARCEADELLRNADIAMYAAKATARTRCNAFEPTMHHSAVERLELRTELPRRARARRVRSSTTSRSSRCRPGADRRRRGARPLAAPDARPPGPGPVHRPGRGDRPDRRRSGAGCSSARAARPATGSSPRSTIAAV